MFQLETIFSILLYHIRYDSVKENEFDRVGYWEGWLGKAETLPIRYRHWICWFLEARCTHWKLSFRVAPDRSTYRKFQPSCTEKGRKWTVGRIRRTNEFGEENSESRRIRISWIRMSSAALKGTAGPEGGGEVPNRLISMLRQRIELKSLRRRYGVKF